MDMLFILCLNLRYDLLLSCCQILIKGIFDIVAGIVAVSAVSMWTSGSIYQLYTWRRVYNLP